MTIPRRIRERYGLRPNSDVEFVEEAGHVLLRPRKTVRSDGWSGAVGVLRGKVKNVDAFLAETRGA